MSLDIFARYSFKEESDTLFDLNITHNLATMAKEAGFYEELWHLYGINCCKELAPIIRNGIEELKTNPEKYKRFSAENGWGTYEQFLPWLEELLQNLEKFPNAHLITCI